MDPQLLDLADLRKRLRKDRVVNLNKQSPEKHPKMGEEKTARKRQKRHTKIKNHRATTSTSTLGG
jgi:hypothetical protein